MKQYFRNPLSRGTNGAKPSTTAATAAATPRTPLIRKKMGFGRKRKGVDMNHVDALLKGGKYEEARTIMAKGLEKASSEKERARIATMLGVFHYYGLGSTPNHNHAQAYFYHAVGGMHLSTKRAKQRNEHRSGDRYGQEHAEAFHFLGVMHAQRELPDANADKALEYYHQAAKYGYDESQYKLGMMYKTGKGVSKNENIAFNYFQKAAHQNHSKAQNQLAMMYADGNGVEKDDKQAVHWYTCAANQGNDIAQYNLGYMYCEGRGVKQSYKQANHWFMKVAEANGYNAKGKTGRGRKNATDTVHSLV